MRKQGHANVSGHGTELGGELLSSIPGGMIGALIPCSVSEVAQCHARVATTDVLFNAAHFWCTTHHAAADF